MQRLGDTASAALRALLDRQPLTEAKVAFAWRIAAGPMLANAASVSWSDQDGRLVVRPRSEAWRHEIMRARPVILERIATLLGSDAVRSLSITK